MILTFHVPLPARTIGAEVTGTEHQWRHSDFFKWEVLARQNFTDNTSFPI